MTEEQPSIQTKTKTYSKYFFAIIIGALFYSFEFLPSFSEDYYNAEKEAIQAKKLNAVALEKVKDYAKGTAVYDEYEEINNRKKEAFEKYNTAVENERFFGFKSFQLFWERLGLFLGILLYALFNLYRSFYFERKNLGNKIIHGFIISVCLFYIFWIFQAFQDFSKPTYYLMTFLSATVVVIAISMLTKYQNHRINSLKSKYKRLAFFSILNTREEKKKEVLDLIEKDYSNNPT